MKKVIVLASFLLGITVIVNAQEIDTRAPGQEKQAKKKANTPEQRAQKSVDALNNDVVLTDDQKVKVKELALNRAYKVDEIRSTYKGKPESKEVAKKEIQTVQKDYREKAKSLLTPEQLNLLKVKHKESKGKGKLNSLDTND